MFNFNVAIGKLNRKMKSSYRTVSIIIISFVLAAFIDTIVFVENGVETITYLPHAFFVAVCLLIWCKQHARENEIKNLRYYPLLCGLLGFIGVPLYAYKHFGFKTGSIIILKAVACLVGVALMAYGVELLTYWFYE